MEGAEPVDMMAVFERNVSSLGARLFPARPALQIANNGGQNAGASARANCRGNNKGGGGASFERRGKLNISLEFSWRPRDVVITPPESDASALFARHASHSHSPGGGGKQMHLIFREKVGEDGV